MHSFEPIYLFLKLPLARITCMFTQYVICHYIYSQTIPKLQNTIKGINQNNKISCQFTIRTDLDSTIYSRESIIDSNNSQLQDKNCYC